MMGNLIRTLATYTFLAAVLALTAYGTTIINPIEQPDYCLVSPANDRLHLGPDGQRRFFADPLSTLPGYVTDFQDRGSVGPTDDCRDEEFDLEKEKSASIARPVRAVAAIP